MENKPCGCCWRASCFLFLRQSMPRWRLSWTVCYFYWPPCRFVVDYKICDVPLRPESSVAIEKKQSETPLLPFFLPLLACCSDSSSESVHLELLMTRCVTFWSLTYPPLVLVRWNYLPHRLLLVTWSLSCSPGDKTTYKGGCPGKEWPPPPSRCSTVLGARFLNSYRAVFSSLKQVMTKMPIRHDGWPHLIYLSQQFLGPGNLGLKWKSSFYYRARAKESYAPFLYSF